MRNPNEDHLTMLADIRPRKKRFLVTKISNQGLLDVDVDVEEVDVLDIVVVEGEIVETPQIVVKVVVGIKGILQIVKLLELVQIGTIPLIRALEVVEIHHHNAEETILDRHLVIGTLVIFVSFKAFRSQTTHYGNAVLSFKNHQKINPCSFYSINCAKIVCERLTIILSTFVLVWVTENHILV